MDPIVLIHRYSAESRDVDKTSIESIYGTLPKALQNAFGADAVVDVNLSRYVSLSDGISIEDVSDALDRALRSDFQKLLSEKFHVLVHSTGALVIRNWIRRYSPNPSPVQTVVHLAGANFGSGWAKLGEGQLAKWGRVVLSPGADRGLRVLEALELVSNWTLDLHLSFLQPGASMFADYQVREFVVIGTQADSDWFLVPIRYAHEDGSDGVVRVAAGNLNFNYLRLTATEEGNHLTFKQARKQLRNHLRRSGTRLGLYEADAMSRPGDAHRPVIPFAIPYGCAHTGEKLGIVTGNGPREQVLRLIHAALTSAPGDYAALAGTFDAETKRSYDTARSASLAKSWLKWIDNSRAQYDRHAQVVFRIRDQHGAPVNQYDIYFDSVQGPRDRSFPIDKLFEDTVKNDKTPNIIVFYLRTAPWTEAAGDWRSRIPDVNGCFLEIVATEPASDDIIYLPLRFELSPEMLGKWIEGHRTTIVDVTLLRLPSDSAFRLVKY